MAVADADAQPNAALWDEEQNITALACLELMQERLNDLRMTIPRVVAPFHAPPSASLYRSFRDNLLASQADIKKIKKEYLGSEMQGVLRHARARLEVDAELGVGAEVEGYGWVERRERLGRDGKKGAEGVVEVDVVGTEGGIVMADEEVERVVGEWRGANGGLKVEEGDGGRGLMISFVTSGQALTFHVTIPRDANAPHKVHAECLGTTDTQTTISRCLASRPDKDDLGLLLDMIAAYKNVKGMDCAKCGKTYDAVSTKPLARRLKRGMAEEERVWDAVHESCLD